MVNGVPTLEPTDRDEGARVLYPTHSLPDEWLATRLAEWFHKEYLGHRVWLCVLLRGGSWRYWTKLYVAGIPPSGKRQYAREVVAHLNKHCNFDGAWLAAWTGGRWERFYLLWKDSDGDIQIPLDTTAETSWRTIRDWRPEVWGQHATTEHLTWRDAQETLELQDGQAVKLAQGEQMKVH